MTETKPGADELRMRQILRQREVGPDAITTTTGPLEPADRPRDWLDDILDTPSTPAPAVPAPTPAQKAPTTKAEQPGSKPAKRPSSITKKTKAKRARRTHGGGPAAPRTAWDTRPPDPRQSLAEAWDRVPYRLKWLAFHATAAGAGWRLGLVTWGTDTAAWFAADHWTSPSAFVVYGLGACAFALHRRARAWAWPVAWAASIPISSIVVGLLLYGTGYHS